jgi:hypothetical protein
MTVLEPFNKPVRSVPSPGGSFRDFSQKLYHTLGLKWFMEGREVTM